MSRKLALLIALTLALTNAFICSAQVEQGSITGSVVDQSGASIPKAKVTATNLATQTPVVTETTDDGYYKIPYLAAGKYTVTAEKEGFNLGRVNGVPVLVGQAATITITLKPGSIHEEITVSANSVMVDQVSSSLGYVTGTTQILELPVSRNPYALATLAPGVIATGNSATGPIVNGGRSNTTAVLFDGQDTRNNSTLDNTYTPPMESVQEVRFITNSFAAEYGRSTGGVLTAASKSGTNTLHGSAYEWFRNDKLNANSWSSNRNNIKKNPIRHNEYGFALSGPVYIPKIHDGRNKTFFFFNWEQMRDKSPNNFTGTVPTALQKKGDFSQTVTSSGALVQIYDWTTTRPDPANPALWIRSPFQGNMLPADRINPITSKLMSYYPEPNLPYLTDNYAQAATQAQSWNKYYVRGDHNFSDKNRMFFRYGAQFSPTTNPFLNIAFPGEGTNGERGDSRTIVYTTTLSDTHTFSPNLVGEFRMSYTRWKRTQNPRSLGFDITSIGLPQYLKAASADALFPNLAPSDVTSIGPLRASHNIDAENTPQPQAQFTWLHGAHAVKAGFDLLFCQFNTFRPDWPSGTFNFDRRYTQGPNPALATTTGGYGVATMLMGIPTGGSFTVGPSLALLQTAYNGYIQDDWSIRRNLTVNLGFRYEYQTPYQERYNHIGYFDPNLTEPLTGKKGMLTLASASHRYPSNPEKKNWAPRVGLAWTFAPNTVFRAGYGWFYAPGSGGVGSSPGDLGSASSVGTGVYLGQAPAAVNTPPEGASIADPFVTGLLPYPNSLVGNGISAIMPNWPTPMNQMWNANIQRNIGRNLLVEVAYAGTRGMHLWNNYATNAVNPIYLSLGTTLTTQIDNPYYGVIKTGSLSAKKIGYTQMLRPITHYTDIGQIRGSVGDSIYHGFTLRVERAYANGFMFQSSFTGAKLIDNVNERFVGGANFINPYNLNQSRSLSASDISKRWVSNFIYALPFGHGKSMLSKGIGGWILGNWQVSGIFVLQNGSPLGIGASCATSLPGIGCYADRSASGVLPADQRNMDHWFDTSAFKSPAQFSMGNGSRTEPSLRNPGQISLDSVMSRWQPIREGMRLQFRAEMYNILNHPNLGGPNTSINSVNFGQITSKSGNRTMTLALRLEF